jgi:hypothetical protein
MPTAAEQEAPTQEEQAAPKEELVSKVPTKVAKKREGDVVYSKSRRQALGGQVTTVFLTADGKFRVEGPAGEDWGEFIKFSGKGQALEVARIGPQVEAEEEPQAEQEETA